MSKGHSWRELAEAAEEGWGVCLWCGEVQEWAETRFMLGVCGNCGEVQVLPAEAVIRAHRLVNDEDEE